MRDQLEVSEAQFWACVRNDGVPDRGVRPIPADALPAELVHLLTSRFGLSDSDVAAMDKTEAVARLNRYWTEGV